jgi:hypothetical protein
MPDASIIKFMKLLAKIRLYCIFYIIKAIDLKKYAI